MYIQWLSACEFASVCTVLICWVLTLCFVCLCPQVRLQGLRLQPGPNNNVLNDIYEAFKAFWWVTHPHAQNTNKATGILLYSLSSLHFFFPCVCVLYCCLVSCKSAWKHNKRAKRRCKWPPDVFPLLSIKCDVFLFCWKPQPTPAVDTNRRYTAPVWYGGGLGLDWHGQGSAAIFTHTHIRLPFVFVCCTLAFVTLWCSLGFTVRSGSAEVKAIDFLLMKCLLTINRCLVSIQLLPTQKHKQSTT